MVASSDSSLSSPPSTDDEMPIESLGNGSKVTPPKKKKQGNILTFFKQKDRSPSPPCKKREPSPEHVYLPEDNPEIAFIVMFRSRFSEAFPRGAPHVGPQDIELGVAQGPASADVEGLLCALVGLVLNRKKPVEKGHYGRALEESVQTQKSQWPRAWGGINPLSGGRNFPGMTASQRITLLHTLSLWSLNQNEQVKAMIANAYKSRTTKDKLDTNIPLSVQPWGLDGEKRRYWLVEGQNDTHFRVYRETDPHKTKKVKWFSVAGDIDELRVVATKLQEEDGRSNAKALSERMMNAIPRFEASEVKRKRREYRLQRTAAFTRPDPGFSLYEGRTRGKRLRYTFSDEEDLDSDNLGPRRSTRTSGREPSTAPAGPTVTASGRQVRSRATGLYGETLHSGQVSDRASPATGDYVRSDISEDPPQPRAHGRVTRNANGRPSKRALESDEEEDATSWDGGDEDENEAEQMELEEYEHDHAEDSSEEEEEEKHSLVVTLRYGKGSTIKAKNTTDDAPRNGTTLDGSPPDDVGTKQPEQPIPAPAQPMGQPATVQEPDILSAHQQPDDVPTMTAAQHPQSGASQAVLSKLDGMLATPQQQQPLPYLNGQSAISSQMPAQQQQPLPPPPPPQRQPLNSTLPSPTPATNWQ